jgi:hypothetical protein
VVDEKGKIKRAVSEKINCSFLIESLYLYFYFRTAIRAKLGARLEFGAALRAMSLGL